MLRESKNEIILGTFANLRKSTISFVLPARPSARYNLAPNFIFEFFFPKIRGENSRFI